MAHILPEAMTPIEALTEIREMAMNHFAFDREKFDARDIDGLCEVGGDVCDWTMVAIHVDDGLKAAEET